MKCQSLLSSNFQNKFSLTNNHLGITVTTKKWQWCQMNKNREIMVHARARFANLHGVFGTPDPQKGSGSTIMCKDDVKSRQVS